MVLKIKHTRFSGHVQTLKSTKDMRSDLVWALNKTYTAHFDFKIRPTRFSGHVLALKSIKDLRSDLVLGLNNT